MHKMKKPTKEFVHDIFALAAFIIVFGCILGGICAWIAAKNDEPTQAAQFARIEAPSGDTVPDALTRVYKPSEAAVEAVTEAESEAVYMVSPDEHKAPAYKPAYVVMDGVPLGADVQLTIEQMCADRGIDVAVVLAMIELESGFDVAAEGDGGASLGLMQVRPDCHYDRMERLGVTDLYDGVQNVTVGIDYLDECLDSCGGDYGAALTMYNRGHYDGVVNGYARKVLEASK